ncbi:MAG: ribonuclease III [Candidatus Berkelbacteria bacterium]|nr:ribonuclease III [Candidatus Berkelbacteria bacterium]
MNEDKNKTKIEKFAKANELKFNNFDILVNAFVHRSYLNENSRMNLKNNERLEFLGDAVLELIITEYLYNRFEKPEGELTALRSALVRGRNLALTSEGLGVYDCLYLSRGERNSSEKAKGLILANALEAIIGAIYLDQGIEATRNFIIKNIAIDIEKVIDEKLYVDAKSNFQEKVQEKFKVTPHYKVISELGPDHDKEFTSTVIVDNDEIAKGSGSSKNIAEQEAAKEALKKLFNQ